MWGVAQLGERTVRIRKVARSIRVISTNKKQTCFLLEDKDRSAFYFPFPLFEGVCVPAQSSWVAAKAHDKAAEGLQ